MSSRGRPAVPSLVAVAGIPGRQSTDPPAGVFRYQILP